MGNRLGCTERLVALQKSYTQERGVAVASMMMHVHAAGLVGGGMALHVTTPSGGYAG